MPMTGTRRNIAAFWIGRKDRMNCNAANTGPNPLPQHTDRVLGKALRRQTPMQGHGSGKPGLASAGSALFLLSQDRFLWYRERP